MHPFSAKMVAVLAIVLVSYSAVWMLPTVGNLFAGIILKSGLFTLLYGGAIYGFNISEDINTTIDQVLRRVKLFF